MIRRGASLLELLVTLALILVVIVVAGGLFTTYSRLSSARGVRDRARQSADDVILALRDDLEAAHRLDFAAADDFQLVRIHHGMAGRLQPVDPSKDWIVESQAFNARIRYHKVNNTLVRSLLAADGQPPADSVLAHDIAGFSLTPSPDPEVKELYQLRVTVQGDRTMPLIVAETSIARMTYLP